MWFFIFGAQLVDDEVYNEEKDNKNYETRKRTSDQCKQPTKTTHHKNQEAFLVGGWTNWIEEYAAMLVKVDHLPKKGWKYNISETTT